MNEKIKGFIVKKLVLTFVMLGSLLAFNSHAAVKIQHWQTAAGTEVYFVENHHLPMIDVSVNFTAGSAHDQQETAGVASLTQYLMRLGADGLSDEAIANQFADVGAGIGGSFVSDRASMTLRTLSNAKEKNQSLRLFYQILHKPDFPEHVLSREKARIVASLQEAATKPAYLADDAYMKAIYGEHPYALNSTVASISSIKRQNLVDFYHAYYGAKNAVIAMIGDLTTQEAKEIAEHITQGLPQSGQANAVPTVALSHGSTMRIAHPASQAHVLFGTVGVKRDDPDLFPLIVGNYILGGGGFVARLTEELRENRGLVYSVYSHFSPMLAKGPFTIGFQTKKTQAAEALTVVRATLNTFLNHGVTAQELSAAKSNITGGFPMRINSNKKILAYLSAIGFYKLPLTYLEDYNQKIKAVTAAQIKAAFNRTLNIERFVTVIVGAETEAIDTQQ